MLLAIVLLAAMVSANVGADASFGRPPQSCRPWTWFHVIGGNFSDEGVTADLEAIRDAGIGGIEFFHGAGPDFPRLDSRTPCLSADWERHLSFLGDECRRLGLGLVLQNGPGWSMAGGPWITNETAMRELVWSFDGSRPVGADYRDLVTLVFPQPEGFGRVIRHEAFGVEANNPREIELGTGKPFVVRTIELSSVQEMNHAWCYRPDVDVAFHVQKGGGWHQAGKWSLPASNFMDDQPISLAVADTTGTAFRLSFSCPHDFKIKHAALLGWARPHNFEAMSALCLRAMMNDRDVVSSSASLVDPSRVRKPLLHEWHHDGVVTLRIGHVNKNLFNGPAPKEAMGWECDKLAKKGVEANYSNYVGRLVREGGPLHGKVAGMLMDSWECKTQNWTDGLDEEFRRRRGYAMDRYWPALCGFVVGSRAETDLFFRDWRQTLSELVSENFYGRAAELARADGLSCAYETAIGDVAPGDILAYYKHAETPMCEFWQPRGECYVGAIDFKPVRPCVSAAHVYGKRRVSAEAFTGRLHWREHPRLLKDIANAHFAYGVTHLVFHTFTHNPHVGSNCLPPGSSFGGEVGTPFLRGQTWWPYMRLFTDYLARCTYMLERGRPVADVLYYLGEDYAHKPDQRIVYADGVEYDYVNADVLLNRLTVKEGRWTTPEGVQYKLLWIPSGVYVSETVRRKIAAGRAAGGRVWDERVEPQSRPVLMPDVLAEGRGGAFRFRHRQDGNAEIYFLTSEGTDAWTGTVSFRATGAAQILDPDTGTSRPLRTAAVGGRTQAEISLPPSGAAFVVIRTDSPIEEVPVEASAASVVLPGPWRLSIDGTILEDAGLGDWLNLSGVSEAVRMFSGTATYRATFAVDDPECVRTLDLGRVEVCATVRVNGLSCGGRWSYPYRYDVSKAVKKGTNVLEVDVTNLWFNRLRYELKHPEVPHRTWTSERPRDEFPDQPSGLFGPVALY